MIELAPATLRDELVEWKEKLRAAYKREGVIDNAVTVIDGHHIELRARRVNVRGTLTLVLTWWLDGRRLGETALMGELKKKGLL